MPDVTLRGVRFATQRMGPEEAPPGRVPVVLVHGMLTGSSASWYFGLAPRLATERPVLTYDQRGHGRSEAVVTGYGLDDLAGDLDALSEPLGPAVVVGHSFGGLVALRHAARRPERVLGVVTVDSFEPGGTAGIGPTGEDAEDLGAVLAWAAANRMTSLVPPDVTVRRRRVPRERILLGGTTLIADLRRDGRLADAELDAVRGPVLALVGTSSPFAGEASAFADRLVARGGRRIDLEGGHALHLDAPDALAASVGELLAGIERELCPSGKEPPWPTSS